MKKLVHLVISFSMLFTMSVVNADTQPVTFSNTETNPCSVILNQDLTFSIPNAIYDAGPFIGKTAFKLDFTFFGEQNGQLLWQFADAGTPPSAPSCSVAIAPDLSFTLEDVIYDAGPSAGKIAFQAEFKYSGEQNGAFLWHLAAIKTDDESSDPTPDSPSSTCGAYVAPDVWKEFDCYNLAAIGKTTNDDPFTPSWRLIGGYWQWGRKGPDPSQWYDTNTKNFAHGPTGPGQGDTNKGYFMNYINRRFISGWESNFALDGAWSDSHKTANDPCPAGFRIPTKAQWQGVHNNNTLSTVGTWLGDSINYTSAQLYGSDLLLPAAGQRLGGSAHGVLFQRGDQGFYWSSSEDLFRGAYGLKFSSINTRVVSEGRIDGLSVRCIAE